MYLYLNFLAWSYLSRKAATETATSGWVCPGMPSQVYAFLDVPRVPLGRIRSIVQPQIIHSET